MGRARPRSSRSNGIVSVLGLDPGQRPPELRALVGIVLQSCGMYRHITTREAVAHWARLYPHPRAVDEVIALAGLEGKEDQQVRTLSGGQARRLDFALALIGDPELIFLDEPTTGFDPAARRAAWDVIRQLADLGKTVLLTTHYLDEAQALADRVAIIKDGRILAEGAPSELGTGSAAHYRVSWRNEEGELQERQTGARRAAARPVGDPSLARGRLPRADRRRDRGCLRRLPSHGISTASSARCSGATRRRRSSISSCRCSSSPSSERSSPATSTTST